MKTNPSRRKFLKTAGKGALATSVAGLFPISSLATQQSSSVRVAVFWETAFPSVRGLNVTRELLQQAFGKFNTTYLNANDLAQLNPSTFDLLVTPFGEAFPKSAWRYLLAYLRGGGNWLNLGGVPLATPVIQSGNRWRTQDRQTVYHKQLGIMHAFPVSAADVASYKSMEQFKFTAEEIYQFNVKFTSSSFFPDEGGSDGPREATLNALAFGLNRKNRAIAAPIIQIDRLQGVFTGGRWVLASFKGSIEPETIQRLAQHTAEGAIRFQVNSEFACYHPGEKPSFAVATEFPNRNTRRLASDISKLEIHDGATKLISTLEVRLDSSGRGNGKLDSELAPGFYSVEGQATVNDVSGGSTYPLRYTTGFWVYDAALIATARPLTVDSQWFYRDGEVFPVTGTTYMASDVHRQFLFEPNAFVWDNDFREMKAAGVNMVRTGLWNSWKKYMPEVGKVSETVLRAMDAFLLTARKYDIPVIFTFFAFIPEAWGGQNSYLDPQALAAQKQFIWAFAERYSKVDDLMWDFINEPSFGSARHVWSCRPNYDDHEKAAWRDWLKQRYPATNDEERAAELQQVWRTTNDNPFDLPRLEDFEGPIIFDARNPLKTLDYRLFAQDMFARWVRQMTEPIRRNGNTKQLITVGQDENGLGDSPNPQFFANTIDFTSLHNWWNNDDLVWDSVLSKVSNKANLVEETGIMFYEKTGGDAWRTDQDARDLLDRKMAISFAAGGAGFIEWVWNTNPYMDITNEAAIGFHRVDGTAKPELDPFLDIAAFMKKHARRFRERQSEQVLMLIPHSQMFTPRNSAFEATRKSIRAMYYHCRVPSMAVSEYTLNKLAVLPNLIVVPAARVLTDGCWQALLAAANRGSTVAITGVIDEDQHWRRVDRANRFGWRTATEPVLDSELIRIGLRELAVRFEGDKIQRIEKAVVKRTEKGQGLLPARVLTARHGQGHLLWSPLPLELGDSVDAASSFYRLALAQARISPVFTLMPNKPSVLVIPTQFRDTVMYTFVSEADEDMKLQLLHRPTNTRVPVSLRAGRTAMLLLDRKSGQVIDSM
jgi:hypothetical protein